MATVKDWREIFQVEELEKPFHIATEAGDCNLNCQTANELKCVCKCGGRNHGAAIKKELKPLDEFVLAAEENSMGRPSGSCDDLNKQD
jgi:hypothetical protein